MKTKPSLIRRPLPAAVPELTVRPHMIVGNPTSFAVESSITTAYERLSFRALGYFNIHIVGHRYGVHAPYATFLACSLDEVESRIARRGMHTAPFATEPDAGEIADAYRDAIYAPDQEENCFFGVSYWKFSRLLYANHLIWAPDGDAAFDDGSDVLQFDVGDRVRLIGFGTNRQGYHHDPCTLADVWLEADEFYRVLEQWRNAFIAEWELAPKIKESEEGTE